jgi:AbrB family looped-hinge helix DNA binding protein
VLLADSVLCGTSPSDVGYVPRRFPQNGKQSVETYTLSLGTRGRIVIPAQLRARIGVRAGDPVAAWVADGVVVLAPLAQIRVRLRTTGKRSTRNGVKALLEQRRMSRR